MESSFCLKLTGDGVLMTLLGQTVIIILIFIHGLKRPTGAVLLFTCYIKIDR